MGIEVAKLFCFYLHYLRENPISLGLFHLWFCLPFWTSFLCCLGLPINRTETKLIVTSGWKYKKMIISTMLFHHIFWHWFAWFFCLAQPPRARALKLLYWFFRNVLINFEHIPTNLNIIHFETCPKPSKTKIMKLTPGFTTGHWCEKWQNSTFQNT